MKLNLLSRRFFALLIVLTCCIGIVNNANASHAMGADLTYKSLGNDRYEITLKFYRDCSGIFPFCLSTSISCSGGVCTTTCNSFTVPYVKYQSASCARLDSIALQPYPAQSVRKEVTPICPSLMSTCSQSNSPYPGAEEWVYKGIVTMPAKCTDWKFSIGINARNAAITTINTPGTESIYLETLLNNTLTVPNSSPEFKNPPVPWVCVGQTFCYNHGAVDADGDSLTYELVIPKTSVSTTVTYKAGYSATAPIKSSPALTLNTSTGDICMTPTQQEVSVMAVQVKEYRNGVLIGSVIRDIQIVVAPCNNALPTVSGIDGTNSYSTSVCPGQQLCFDVFGLDTDAGQTTTLNWNNAITGATFTTTGSTGHFCWTPTAADARSTPYTFTVTVQDNACPYFGFQTFAYSIIVKTNCAPSVTVTGGEICRGNCFNLVATPGSGAPPYKYSWTPSGGSGSSASVCPTTTTIYTVTITDSLGQVITDTATVVVNPLPTIGISSNSAICTGGSAVLSASGANTYSWSPGGMTGSSVSVSPVNTTTYTVTGTSAAGCSATASTTVTVNPSPVISISNNTSVCAGGSVQLTASGGNTYNWSPGNATGSSVMVTPSSTTTYTVTANATGGCTATASVTVTVNPLPNVTFAPFTSTICVNATPFTLTGGSPTGGSYSGKGVTGSTFDPAAAGVGTWTLTYNYTDPNGCSGSATTSVTVDPAGTVTINSIPSLCVNASPVTLTGSPAGGTFSGTGVVGNTFDPSIAGPGPHVITYTFNSNPCLFNTSASTTVTVTAPPAINITVPPSIGCINNTYYTGYGNLSVTLTANVTGTVTNLQWYLNGSAIPGATSTTLTANQSGWYNVLGTVNGCASDSSNTGFNLVVVDVRCGHDTSKKVTICHVPDCRYDKQVTICISENAVPAHFKNHPCDCLGPCSTPHPNKRVADADLSGIGFAAYPNPFSKETSLEFIVSDPNQTVVEIYDLNGQLITELFNGYAEEDFDYSLKVSGLSSGIYIAKLQSGDFSKHLKLVVAE